MQTALVLPIISPESLEFGGMTTIEKKIIFPNGSILEYLPNFEGQSHTYFDDNYDPSVSPRYLGRGKEVGYSPFTIFVSKVGYNTYTLKTDITEKFSQTISLVDETFGNTTIYDSTLIDTTLY